MNKKLLTTQDGSPTIFIEEMNETYHSIHGALTESVHVFINAGLKYAHGKKINIEIFEVGLGTGLNAWLTALEQLPSNGSIKYTAIEPYPLENELKQQLIAQDLFKESHKLISQIHSDAWGKEMQLSPHFSFRKIKIRLEDFSESHQYDLVYMDAFAPSKQAEVWSLENIEKLYNILLPGGTLVSYCASGAFKRNLKASGFVVESLPGPPGKFEMTRATKI